MQLCVMCYVSSVAEISHLIKQLLSGCVGLNGKLQLRVYGGHPDINWLRHVSLQLVHSGQQQF